MNRIFTPLLLMLIYTVNLSAQVVTDKQITLITKKTADWCPYCGTYGWQFTSQLITAAQGKDAILWNVHHSGNLMTPTSKALADNFGGFSQPLIFVNTDEQDLDLTASNVTSTVDLAIASIDLWSSLGAIVGMGSTATLQGDDLTVNSKVKFYDAAESGEYYIGMYIVQKNRVAYQQSVGQNAVHHSLLTNSILANPFGTKIADAPIGNGEEFTLTGNLNNLVLHNGKLADTKVVTIIWNKFNNRYNFVNAREVDIVLDNTSSTNDNDHSKLDFTAVSFNGEVEFTFNKDVSDDIDIQLYNVTGQKVNTQITKTDARHYKLTTNDVTGNHFVIIRNNNEMVSKQILIIR